jgi:benzoyl-CoA 2,3-epoxidase subunit B
LKGRFKEQEQYTDHIAAEGSFTMLVVEDGKLAPREVPLRNALNEILRGEYVKDCEKGLARWNKALTDEGIVAPTSVGEANHRLKSVPPLYLPNIRFHRHVGEYAGHHFDIEGNLIAKEQFEAMKDEWLPTIEDREYVRSLMKPVTEVGKIANWIAPPTSGIKGKPFEFEYVRL